MKLGIIVSLVIVILIGVLGFVSFRGIADPPTAATSAEKLVKISLPTDLGSLYQPTQPTEDATESYAKVIAFYQEHHQPLSEPRPQERFTDPLTDLLIEAMRRGRVQHGFLDQHIPVQPASEPDFGDALEAIPGLVLFRANELYEGGNTQHAVAAVRAVWALGRRAFEQNDRLYVRRWGLPIMIDAGDQLFAWADQTDAIPLEKIQAWASAITEVERAFREKDNIISAAEPHIGDLLNIAQHDQDLTFRVAATLKLGVMQYNPGNRGNQRVILQTLTETANATEPLLAQAGKAAQAVTREQVRKLR